MGAKTIPTDKSLQATVEKAVKKIKEIDCKNKIQFITLYGSITMGRYGKISDIDLAIGYEGNEKQRFDFRVRVLGELGDKFDVQIFQDLPLYIRIEVLKGKFLYVKDPRSLNEIALETIRDFEYFKPHFLDYIWRYSRLRRDLMETKIKEMGESLKLVGDNLPGRFEEFVNLGLVKDGIYKRIEFCIQSVLDICAIINSDMELGIPPSEENIVENLVGVGILSARMGEKVKRMRGFRNFLVHRYGRINDKMAFENIKGGLRDFHKFAEEIKKSVLKRT